MKRSPHLKFWIGYLDGRLKIIDGKIDAFVVDTVRPIAGSLLVETIQGTGAVVKFTDKREAIFDRQYYRVKVE